MKSGHGGRLTTVPITLEYKSVLGSAFARLGYIGNLPYPLAAAVIDVINSEIKKIFIIPLLKII